MFYPTAKITEKDIPKLKTLLEARTSYEEIGKIFGGINYRTVSYYIRKLGLHKLTQQFEKEQQLLGNAFERIDTAEKAYALGFILGDGHISQSQKDYVEVSIALADKAILDFIAIVVKGNVTVDNTVDKRQRRFPSACLTKTIPHISKHLGGRLKQERHFPRIGENLTRFLLLGFFDADGSITFGRRKDRNRFWVNIGFTHHLKCLLGLQQMLLKELNISTAVCPKSGENAYVIKFSGKRDVLAFLDYIYPDDSFIVLRRKYEKAEAVRLELGEFGETTPKQRTIPSRVQSTKVLCEGVETRGCGNNNTPQVPKRKLKRKI